MSPAPQVEVQVGDTGGCVGPEKVPLSRVLLGEHRKDATFSSVFSDTVSDEGDCVPYCMDTQRGLASELEHHQNSEKTPVFQSVSEIDFVPLRSFVRNGVLMCPLGRDQLTRQAETT